MINKIFFMISVALLIPLQAMEKESPSERSQWPKALQELATSKPAEAEAIVAAILKSHSLNEAIKKIRAVPDISDILQKHYAATEIITNNLGQHFKDELANKYTEAIKSFKITGGQNENEMYRLLAIYALNIPGASNWLRVYADRNNLLIKPGFSNLLARMKLYKMFQPVVQQEQPVSQAIAPKPVPQPTVAEPAPRVAPTHTPQPRIATPVSRPVIPMPVSQPPVVVPTPMPVFQPVARPSARPSEAVLGMLITGIENNSNGYVDLLLSEGSSRTNLDLKKSEEIRPGQTKSLDMSIDISQGMGNLSVTSGAGETSFQITHEAIEETSKNRPSRKLNRNIYQISKIIVDKSGTVSLQPV